MLEGMLWVLRTGAPWRDLPERFGSWKTVSSRFYRWRWAGVWDQVLTELRRQAERDGNLDWTLHFVDSTTVRAHQHAAGARRAPESEALGRSRGGLTTKIHLRAERQGKPVVVELTPGESHEQPMIERLMERGAVKRGGGAVGHACDRSVSRATRHTAAPRCAATSADGESGQSSRANQTSSEMGGSTDRPTASATWWSG